MMNISDAGSRLKAIFEAAVDGIIIIDKSGIIEDINPSALRLFGYQKEELIGLKVNDLMPSEHSHKHDEYISNYHKTGSAKIIGIGRKVSGRKKNGEFFPFWLAVSEVKLDSRTIFTGFIHDLTEVINAENRLIQLNDELEKKVLNRTYELEDVINRLLSLNQEHEVEIKTRIKTEEKLIEREKELKISLEKEKELGELKSRFVSMASHEFRTPLSTILSSVSLLGRYTESDQQSNRDKHITKIKSGVGHLTGILNDFLSMNKLEEGKVFASVESFNINELCIEVIEELQNILKQNQNLTNHCHLKNTEIKSDRKIVKNILINLLSNAIKYTGEDGNIDCTLKIEGSNLLIIVKDNGIGIPQDEQKHLFDRFFRASNATNIEGTGLGLNIVKKYAEILGGSIQYSSKLYVGTTFTVCIPTNNDIPD